MPFARGRMSAMRFGSETYETETSFAVTGREQVWLGPEGGNGRIDDYLAIPRYSKDTTSSPASAVVQAFERNVKITGTFALYTLGGMHTLHSRDHTLWLHEPGELTGALRLADAVKLAEKFPAQIVHPDAVDITAILAAHPLTGGPDGFDQLSTDRALAAISRTWQGLAAEGQQPGPGRLFAPASLEVEAWYLAETLASRGEVNRILRPFTRSSPASGVWMPATMLLSVLLPAPFSPQMA